MRNLKMILLSFSLLAAFAVTAAAQQRSLYERLGGKEGPGLEPGKFIAPHGLALDSKGDIYVGEVSYTNWKTSFPDKPMPSSIRSLQKLEKVS